MYKAIIIDDEKMARTLLEGMVQECCADVSIVESCKDLPSGVKAIRKHKPQLVFLDIEMPGHSGLELLDFFNENETDFSIIFTTAYNQYAIQAFKLSAIDYLLKPIETEELEQAIDRFRKHVSIQNFEALKSNLNPQNGHKKISIHTTGAIKFIEVNAIVYLKADGTYTNICLEDGSTIMANKTLKVFEDILTPMQNFYRCHKSYIVNINYISEFVRSDGGYLLLQKSHKISISGDKVETLLSLIARFM